MSSDSFKIPYTKVKYNIPQITDYLNNILRFRTIYKTDFFPTLQIFVYDLFILKIYFTDDSQFLFLIVHAPDEENKSYEEISQYQSCQVLSSFFTYIINDFLHHDPYHGFEIFLSWLTNYQALLDTPCSICHKIVVFDLINDDKKQTKNQLLAPLLRSKTGEVFHVKCWNGDNIPNLKTDSSS